MGSSSKKVKDKESSSSSSSRKRRNHSPSALYEQDAPKEKRHKHHRRHHKDRKREKQQQPKHDYESEDSDVVEVVSPERVATPPPPHIDRQEPESSSGFTESLSIEETNKLRAKLGLKPLQVEHKGSRHASEDDGGKRKDDLGEFYHKPAHNLGQRVHEEKMRSRLSERRTKRSYDDKYSKVSSLGAADTGDEDAAAWIAKSRQIENAKKEAQKRAKMLEEMDAQFGIGEIVEAERLKQRNRKYTEKSLKGLQVDHDANAFKQGETVILTLKDSGVLDTDGDVLVNVNMRDNEKYQKNIENKKKKSFYSNDDFDEMELDPELQDKSLLGKYDEEIGGEKKEGFKIGVEQLSGPKPTYSDTIKNKLLHSLATTSNLTVASDYYNEEELAKFKKPKKKVRKVRAKGKILSADDLENMTKGEAGKRRGERADHLDFDDVPNDVVNIKLDIKTEEEAADEFEALRKIKQVRDFKAPKVSPPKRGIRNEPQKYETNFDSNMVLNATAEFCRTLGDIPTYGRSGNREDIESLLELAKDDLKMEDLKDEEEEDEGGKWNQVDLSRVAQERFEPEEVVETPILDEEPDVGSGVGAALQLARSKGYLDKETDCRPSNSRLAHLQAQHYSIEDKSYGDETERGNRRERYSGPIQDFKEKDSFKPNVKLEYIDDDGHILNPKEAFRYLSHKFHGKGPGKNKVEKRLKKSQQEGLMKKMSSTDTPLGTLHMLQSKQKEMQSPYIVLSGGKHTHSTTISKTRRQT